ncbi:MAG: SDR family NAD(P)-dependent oxidoreductase [Deltaproteobacteria bacterium]|jgi:NAD(P)-dependent dehydrogenase (short-subunit alcohol dehydrogenase family)|nr:SDR family NAD(P)-dependent oxidoreductase [Deltaproteobacteria bacterium]MBT4089560.1 SDR family NAD(P)-dependent oxidoreductase [Deltaproteobacteria bacterium]MBT4263870.1 SDR family NAD(P)-dependent oxidoreductase [Deltaproteobacteria bacterium]MBT4639491.1 SDR family NAD(P)-dependent oxidoreductase [Deltaproteobacteria bacterium]MBT6501928.1 SDR family NAD(P)-dependent oxidoreductase [Deltaproteobacteria bacterium]
MTIDFKNKVAVITGAGRGLGKTHAHYLSSRGARIVVNDLDTIREGDTVSPAQKVVDDVIKAGGDAVLDTHDITDYEGAQQVIGTAIDQFGSCDILVCNAGIIRDKTLTKMTVEEIEDVINVHLFGSIYPVKSAYPFMKKAEYGRIVMTTSASGLYGNFGQTNYSAAKMGIVGFMNALKLEGQKYNVLVNTIAPLAVTPMASSAGVFPKDLNGSLKPEWVSSLVAYLCSDQCQSTGDIFSVGGGYYARVQMQESPGLYFDSENIASSEEIASRFDEICDMKGSRHFSDLMHFIQDLSDRRIENRDID